MASKYRTRDQVRQAQGKAVRFAQNVLVDDDLADELEGLSTEGYAERKGLVIRNPQNLKGTLMPRKNDLTDRVADLEDKLDLIAGIISGDVPDDDDSDDDSDDDDDL